MNKNIKFMFSTLVAAAAMTSTAWAEGTTETTTLYVDSSVIESTEGYGVTKFATVDAAMKVAQENGGAIINLGELSRPEEFPLRSDNSTLWRTNGTYTFTGGNYGDLHSWVQTAQTSDVNIDIVFDKANIVVGKFRLDTGSSLTITDSHLDSRGYLSDNRGWTTFYGDSTITIKNSVVGYHAKDNATDGHDADSRNVAAGDKTTDYSSYDAGMVFGGSGVMTVENSTIFAYTNTSGDNNWGALSVHARGLMEFKDSAVYAHSFVIGLNNNSTIGRDNDVATMVLDNSVLRDINGDPGYHLKVGDGVAGALILKNGAEINHGAAMTVNGNGSVSVTDSVLKVGSLTNKNVITLGNGTLSFSSMTDGNTGAQLYVTGTSTISGTSIAGDGKLRVGQIDSDGDGVADGYSTNNKITFDVKEMSFTFGNIYNTDVNFKQDSAITLTGTIGSSYLFVKNSKIDISGKKWTVNGGLVVRGSTLGNGELVFDGAKGTDHKQLVFQDCENAQNVIAADATVNVVSGGGVHFYEDTTINGALNDKRVKGNAILVGHGSASDYTDGAVLTVSGKNAKLVSENNSMTVYGANEEKGIQSSTLVVENGGTVEIGGTLTNSGAISLNNASLTAVNVTNSGAITLVNSTLKITGTLTNTGTLNLDSKSQILGANGETGVSVSNTTINVSDANVAISVATDVIFKGVEKLATDGITTDAIANVKVLGAWDFAIDADGNEVTVTVDVGELSAADQANLAILHKADDATDWTKTEIKGEYKDGKVTFKTNSFSSYAVAIPEPSAFGLLAGLGALALVGARRRRR